MENNIKMSDIQGYDLINPEKTDRALNGLTTEQGARIGGVGKGAYYEDGVWKRDAIELTEDEIVVLETALLAEYDKLGGAIFKNGDRVKMGSFFDFKGKKPRPEAKVVFTHKINGKVVEVPADEETPSIVKASKILKEQEAAEKPKKIKKTKTS